MAGKTKSNPVFVLLLSLCDKQAKKDNYDAFAHFFCCGGRCHSDGCLHLYSNLMVKQSGDGSWNIELRLEE